MAEFYNHGSLSVILKKDVEIELEDVVTHERVKIMFRFGVIHLSFWPATYDRYSKDFVFRNYQAFVQPEKKFAGENKYSAIDWQFGLKIKEKAIEEMDVLIAILRGDGRLNMVDCIELNNGKLIIAYHPQVP